MPVAYLTKHEHITIAGVHGLQIRSLLDRLQYCDPLGEAEAVGISSAAWPLFGLAWPSGVQLAAHMAARGLQGAERILEVGCGLALASLVCHRQGADVTASDRHPLTGEFLETNLGLNGLGPLRYRHGDWSCASPAPGQGRHPAVQGRFDIIMGSDVLYERDDEGFLAGFIERHARPRAEVMIVDPNRGNRSAFTRRLKDQGYLLRETALALVDAAGTATRGRFLHYTRGALPGHMVPMQALPHSTGV